MLKLKVVDEDDEEVYEGFIEHFSPSLGAIAGYDEVNKTWMPIGITNRGQTKTANYIWNTNTLAWETATGSVSVGQITTAPNYTIRIDTVESITYIGKAIIGSDETDAVWQMKYIDETLGLIILWADGNENFDNKWSDHLIKDFA